MRGYSLVEFVVAFVMVFVLLFTGWNFASKLIERVRLEACVKEISSIINYCRNKSDRDGERIVVAFVQPSLFIAFEDKNRNGIMDGDDQVIATKEMKHFYIARNTIKRKCFEGKGRCFLIFPWGLPLAGSTAQTVELASRKYGDVRGVINIHAITGVSDATVR